MLKIKNNKNSIFFLTYGDDRFKESRKRIIKESINAKVFSKCILETREIKKEKEFKDALKNKQFQKSFEIIKGGGCYIWKPYIIYKHLLNTLSENDILVYADSGSTVVGNKKKFHRLFNLIQDEKGVLVARNGTHLESEYCKGDVFKYFKVEKDPSIWNTITFQCSTHFVKKCNHSLQMYKKWWDIAKNRPDLFDNNVASEFPNYQNYIRHVWDTGTWSLICKTMGYSKEVKLQDLYTTIKVTRIRK